jgi:elongation factor G
MSNKSAATRTAPSKSSARGLSAPVETAQRPELIRNVALVGHSGAGKTTLTEALLEKCGVVPRAGSIADGTTVSDSDPIEVALQHSVALAVCPLPWQGHTINLIDTPGTLDFSGELRAGLRAADAALFVLSAADEIDPVTLALWEECAATGTPRGIVVDQHEASRDALAAAMQRAADVFGADGSDVLPLYLPAGASGSGGAPHSLLGLLTSTVYDYSEGFPPRQLPFTADVEVDGDPEGGRATLIEAIIERSEDESLLERYLAGESADSDVLLVDLATAIRRGHFFPVLPVDTASGLGLAEVLEGIVRAFPDPTHGELPAATHIDGSPTPALECDPDGPLVAEVVHTSIDPYLGRLSVLRVFSGTLTAETPIHVSGHGGAERGHPDHDADERLGALHSPLGTTLRPVQRVIAGDLCAISRLDSAETGDTISAKAEPLLVAPWQMPEPLLPIAVLAPTRNDEDALAKALGRLAAADPTVRMERPGTGQLVLWCLGEAHAELMLQRLRAFGAQVATEPVKVALLETFAGDARGHGRLVKQSGGHGQYAVCDVVVTAMPRGSGVEFTEKVVGGAVPSHFISSVEKGVRAQLAAGLDDRHIPVTDVRVTLVDGKAHSVDSSDSAFQTSGALAVRDAATQAGLALLEPLAQIEVSVPDAYVGAVMSDLSGRRGRLSGSSTDAAAPAGLERTVVSAEVPEMELLRYAVTLRGLSAGAGRFTRRYSRHDVVPSSVVATLDASRS